MLTGRHFVRDVFCKKCSAKLGWMYEYATENEQVSPRVLFAAKPASFSLAFFVFQRYKEGHVILERALISESDGL